MKNRIILEKTAIVITIAITLLLIGFGFILIKN
jgi:cell division protein FtsX